MRIYVVYVKDESDGPGFRIDPRDFADYDTRTEENVARFELFLVFPSQTEAYYWVREHGYDDSYVVVKAIDIEEFAVKPSEEKD